MDFNSYALCRDILYISGAVTGVALGLLLGNFRKDLNAKNKSRRIALAMFFFSGTVAGLAISFIISYGAIFTDIPALVFSGVFIVLCALSVIFPRVVAYPLILLGGLAVTWLCIFCLRFPAFSGIPAFGITHIENSPPGSNTWLIDPAPGTAPVHSPNSLVFNEEENKNVIWVTGNHSFLTVRMTTIEIERHFPFAGGAKHCLVTAINSDTGLEYSDNSLQNPLASIFFTRRNSDLISKLLSINTNEYEKNLPLEFASPRNKIIINLAAPEETE